MKRILVISIFVGLLGGSGAAYSQDSPVGEVEDAQIIIEKDAPLTLPKAARIYKPVAVDIVVYDEGNLEYQVSNPELVLAPYERLIRVQEYRNDLLFKNKDGFLKVGFGNYISPSLFGYYRRERDKSDLSAFLDFESFARGPIREEESAYSRFNTGFDLGHEFKGLKLGSQLNYMREGYYFYGFDQPSEIINPNPLLIDDRIARDQFQFGAGASSNTNSDWTWFINPSIELSNMSSSQVDINKEFVFRNELRLSYEISEAVSVSLESNYDLADYQSGFSQQRHVFSASPNMTWQNDNLELTGGINVALGEDNISSRTKVYPLVKANWLASDELTISGEVSGESRMSSLSSLLGDNRYLNDSLNINNQDVNLKLAFGVLYQISDLLSIKPFISYVNISNNQFFISSVNDSSRFELITETGGFGQVDIGSTISFIKGNSQLSAQLTYSNYQTEVLAEAWHLPTTQVLINYEQLIGNSLRVHTNFHIMDGIAAFNPSTSDSQEISMILDIGMGVQYEINDSFSAFVDVKNLLGVDYERYLNYPVRGITGKLGFIYRF